MKKTWRTIKPWRRGLSLLMASIFCLSAIMAGTLALTGDRTSPDNVFVSRTGGGSDLTQLTVNKVWVGGSNRPDIQVQIYQDGTAYGVPVTLNAGNGWNHTWTSLAAGHTYTADEVSVPSGYTKSVAQNSATSVTITNTYTGGGGGDLTQFTVQKVWSGGSSRPDIQVQLYRDGTAHGAPVTLNAGNNWNYTWTSLAAGHTYTADEVSVPSGYTKSVAQNSATLATITNTYHGSGGGDDDDDVDVSVTKVWAGSTNANQPASVQVQLYRNGSAYGNPVTLNDANNWKHIWRNLSDRYNYTVDEVSVPESYTMGVSHTGNAWTITNTYSPNIPVTPSDPSDPPADPDNETVTVSGVKTWRHGSNPEDKRPTAITVHIMNGQTAVRTITVTAADGWRYSATLPRYDGSGNEISYTVSEDPVPGYRAAITGYNITNIHESGGDGGPKTGDDNAMLLWFGLMLASAIGMKLALGNVTLRRRRI